jgi:hypothetical protein
MGKEILLMVRGEEARFSWGKGSFVGQFACMNFKHAKLSRYGAPVPRLGNP